LRLSTVGRDVLDGKGLAVSEGRGVSVNISVGVMETVCVAVGARGVLVTGANDVFVGRLVPTTVGGTGAEVKVQANEVITHKMEKTSFRLISEIQVPFGNNIPEYPEN
jgi:hypothetical protein